MRRDRQRLEDILEAIERIEKYASGGRESFDRDELVQTWVVHHLQIIGEAVRGLSDEIRSAHPDIPWAQIAAMRNILVHDYFGIDLEEVWAAVADEAPVLHRDLQPQAGPQEHLLDHAARRRTRRGDHEREKLHMSVLT